MSSHPGSRRFSKRGGKFTRSQLEIVRKYLQTKENPDRHSLLNAKFEWDSSSDGPLVRFKTACKRLCLNDENMLIHITGKIVIPVEEFISTIQRAHKGEKEDEHLHFSGTLKRLSETYTIGRRTYGMSKKLIEAVVKSCNSGLCWKEKKNKRKREYEDTVKRFTRKCFIMGEPTVVSSQIQNEQEVTKHIQGETNDNSQACDPSTSSTNVNGKVKKNEKYKVKLKKKKKILVNKLPSLVQKSTTITASTATSNKSDIISIGPFPVSVLKNGTDTGQYQLGLLLPVVSQQGTMSQNTATTGNTGNMRSLCIPVMNVSSAPGVSGVTGKVASSVNVSGNIAKTINLSQMQFSTLLQNMAKNSQTDAMNKVSTLSKSNDEITHQPNMVIKVPLEKGNSSLKLTLKQKLQVQSKEISQSPSKEEPPQKKTKIVKISTDGKVFTCTDMKPANEENINKSENDDVIIVDGNKTDENNNLNGNSSISQSIELDEDWSDENFQALEYVKNSGMYKSCLKALCSLDTEDFETVMDRMGANVFSEEPNPFVKSYHPVTDPPYPHIWYFYHEISQEKNIFSRMMIVMKDIRIDMMRSLMQELLAHDRLKRSIKLFKKQTCLHKNNTNNLYCMAVF